MSSQTTSATPAQQPATEAKPARSLGPLRMIWRETSKYPRQVAFAAVALMVTATATLAIPAGFRLIDSEVIVKTGMTATITAKVGFAYADGVDSTAVPQDDDFFGTGITVATAGRYRNATSNTSVVLPKEAWLTLTTAVAANAKASELEIIVFAINEGVA